MAELRVFDGGGDGEGPVFPDLTDGKKPKPTYRNTRIALTCFGARFSFNEFNRRFIVEWQMLDRFDGVLSDAAVDKFRGAILARFGFDPKKENTSDALSSLCWENSFDPIKDYLNALKWDGRPRLNEWLTYYLGADSTALNREFGRKALIAAVRRARSPGCKFDNVLVLEGGQGTGKSSALRVLAGSDEAFTDQDMLHLDAKAQQEALAGKWIVELAELAGMRRTDAEKIKAFASRTHDRARGAYARFTDDQPRRCVMVGTTNADEYLSDPTGNRRFWPVKTNAIDLDALITDRDQIWAEAAMLEKGGETLLLSQELWSSAAKIAAQRLERDPWEDLLRKTAGTKEGDERRISSADLMGDDLCLKIPRDRQTTPAAQRLARVMKKLGWDGPKRIYIGGVQVRGYSRPSMPEDEDK